MLAIEGSVAGVTEVDTARVGLAQASDAPMEARAMAAESIVFLYMTLPLPTWRSRKNSKANNQSVMTVSRTN
jgi:hypothetical protein